jgi:peptidoglycan/LPS O-acetylase OafA/YrhL
MAPPPIGHARSEARQPGLDLLRAIAIVLVALFHLPLESPPGVLSVIEQCGWMGVDLFFVLSGYLIGSQLLRPYIRHRTPSLRVLFLRRAFRVLPAFLVVLLIYVFVPGFRERPNLPNAWRFLTFTQNFGLQAPAAFSHAWSLCVEEHFYLIFPFLVLWLMREPSLSKTVLVAGLIFVTGLVIRSLIWGRYLGPIANDPKSEHLFAIRYWEMIYFPTYARLDGLLVGVLLAAVSVFRPACWILAMSRQGIVLMAALILLSLAVWCCWDLYSVSAVVWGYPLVALGFGFLVLASCSLRVRIPGATLGATLAYSAYLTHKAVMHLDRLYLGDLLKINWVISVAILATTSLVVAAALYVWVERPFLRLRDRIVDSIQTKRIAAAGMPNLAESK